MYLVHTSKHSKVSIFYYYMKPKNHDFNIEYFLDTFIIYRYPTIFINLISSTTEIKDFIQKHGKQKHSKCMQLQLLWKRMTIKDGLWYIEILQTTKEYSTTSIIVRPLCASLSILYIFCVIVFSIAPSIKTKCHNVADRHQIYLENMLKVCHISSQIQFDKTQTVKIQISYI